MRDFFAYYVIPVTIIASIMGVLGFAIVFRGFSFDILGACAVSSLLWLLLTWMFTDRGPGAAVVAGLASPILGAMLIVPFGPFGVIWCFLEPLRFFPVGVATALWLHRVVGEPAS